MDNKNENTNENMKGNESNTQSTNTSTPMIKQSNQFNSKRKMIALIAMLVVVILGTCYGIYRGAKKDPIPTPVVVLPNEIEPEIIPNPRVKLCFAGDIVQHMPINTDAYNQETGKYDFTYLYEYARKYFEVADYSACCIETTLNTKNRKISSYPQFCSPDEVATSLKEVGMDLIATSSNHANDTRKSGIDTTLDVLDEIGLDHVGTYRSQEERDKNHGVLLKNINDISIAFLNYTYGTNGISADAYPYAINIFNKDYLTYMRDINYELVGEDMKYARSLNPDMIVVMVHWGLEYKTVQNSLQEALADFLFQEGATLVIGGHPHVPQGMEVREIPNDDGTTRTGYIVYSLGNFISNQPYQYTDITAIVNIEIEKDLQTNQIDLKHIDYVPMYMLHPNASNTKHYCLLDIHKAMQEYESGDTTYVNATVYNKLKTALSDCHKLFKLEELVLDKEAD